MNQTALDFSRTSAELNPLTQALAALGRPKTKIVLPGGPGVSKTSCICSIKNLGFEVTTEVFTELFAQAASEQGLEVLFQDAPKLLHDLVHRQLEGESSAAPTLLTFYDRCRIDLIGFAENLNLSFTAQDLRAVYGTEYHLAFLVEPLPQAHYLQNAIRRHNFQESLKHHRNLVHVYQDYCLQKKRNPAHFLVTLPHAHLAAAQANTEAADQVAVDRSIQLRLQKMVEFVLACQRRKISAAES